MLRATALAGALLLLATSAGAQVSSSATQSSTTTSGSQSGSQASANPTNMTTVDVHPFFGNTANNFNGRNINRSTTSSNATTSSSAQGGQGGQGGRGGRATGGSAQQIGNQVQVVTADPSAGSGGRSGGYIEYGGGYTQTLRNTPEIIAPSINGGANTCAVGLSGGLSVAGFGITTGAGWSDPDCERRQLAALAYNVGDKDLSAEVMCGSKDIREARLRLGRPCLADRQNLAQVDPAIIRRQQDSLDSVQRVSAPAPLIPPPPPPRPEWCYTASAQEKRAHPECN